jgi:hypothetical protein
VGVLEKLATDGPYLTSRYTMTRDHAILGRPVTNEFAVHVHGLGYSQVSLDVLDIDLSARLFVLATPAEGETIQLVALSVKAKPGWADPPAAEAVPGKWVGSAQQARPASPATWSRHSDLAAKLYPAAHSGEGTDRQELPAVGKAVLFG